MKFTVTENEYVADDVLSSVKNRELLMQAKELVGLMLIKALLHRKEEQF